MGTKLTPNLTVLNEQIYTQRVLMWRFCTRTAVGKQTSYQRNSAPGGQACGRLAFDRQTILYAPIGGLGQ